MLPGLIYYAIFRYGPMYGILLAFKKYSPSVGVLRSPWVGLKNIDHMFKDPDFIRAFSNTIIISFGRILTGFSIPILFAVLFNELKSRSYKRVLQTIYTFPHFLSWVVISGIIINLLASDGAVNNIILALEGTKIDFLANKKTFRFMLYFTAIWKEAGWSSILYLAAITAINPELYQSAMIDGANRFHETIYITLPCIRPTITVLLILSVGGVMNAGFEQIFNLQNPAVRSVSEIIDTYVYRITFESATDFSFSTAVGLFKSIINFILLISFNHFSKVIGESGIF